jgi:hypothetical protein
MRIHWSAALLLLGIAAGALGCGSYSAPNNTPMSPDSSGSDSMPPPPGY